MIRHPFLPNICRGKCVKPEEHLRLMLNTQSKSILSCGLFMSRQRQLKTYSRLQGGTRYLIAKPVQFSCI